LADGTSARELLWPTAAANLVVGLRRTIAASPRMASGRMQVERTPAIMISEVKRAKEAAMLLTDENHLKRVLYDAYGGFADKRIKKLESGSTFIADDRTEADYGADKRLYPNFCAVFVEVLDGEEVLVRLTGNVPVSPGVKAWIKAHKGEYRAAPGLLAFRVKKGEQAALSALAAEIKKIVAPGAPRYKVPSYKFACPRTAKSLEQLEKTLTKAWAQ